MFHFLWTCHPEIISGLQTMDVRESQNLGSAEQVLYSQFRRLVRVYARQRNSVTNDAHGPHPATRPLLLLGKPAETYRPGRREPRHAPPRRRQHLLITTACVREGIGKLSQTAGMPLHKNLKSETLIYKSLSRI
jgi:hypothetical protein